MTRELVPHSSHWGAFEAEVADGTVVAIRPYRNDSDPSPLLGNIVDSLRHPARVTQPMIRAGWLDRGPGPDPRRGAEPFVPVSWPTAVNLLAAELRRVYAETGGAGVYGGSYGWSSAGRFHHAQSQLHRFLNCLGGYVRGEHSYSNGAQSVIMPHVVGSMREFLDRATAWSVLERHTELFVCFGGIPLKNTMVSPGGASRHPARDHLRAARARGAEFVLVSPLRSDLARIRGRRVAPHRPGQRRRGHARARPHPPRRGAPRPRLPPALLRRVRPLRALRARRHRRLSEDAGVGGRPVRDSRVDHPRSRPAHGREANPDQRELLASAGRARRAGAVARRDPGRHARPDRAARRRLRPGLRLPRLRRPRSPSRRAAHAAARAQPGRRASSPSRASPTCCCIRARRSISTGHG